MSTQTATQRSSSLVSQAATAPLTDSGAGSVDFVSPTGGDSVPRSQWLDLLERDRQAPIDLHPDLATDPEAFGADVPSVYSRWKDDDASVSERSLAGLAVVAMTSKPFRILPLLTTRLRGHWLVGGRVLSEDDQTEPREFLRWTIAQMNEGRSNFMLLEDIVIGEPLWNAAQELKSGGDVTVLEYMRREPRWWIDFPDPAKDYWDKFSKKTAANFHRRARKFGHELVRYDRADQIDEFLEKAHQVTAKSWQWVKLRRGVHNDARERRFLGMLAEHGAMRCYLLTTREAQPISYVLGFQWNDCYVYDKVGYDPAFTNESPGTVLLVKLIDDLIELKPPRTLDFCSGRHEYKETFGNRQTLNGSLLLARKALRPGIVARLDRWNYVGLNAANRVARRAFEASGLWPLVRRLRKKA